MTPHKWCLYQLVDFQSNLHTIHTATSVLTTVNMENISSIFRILDTLHSQMYMTSTYLYQFKIPVLMLRYSSLTPCTLWLCASAHTLPWPRICYPILVRMANSYIKPITSSSKVKSSAKYSQPAAAPSCQP